jgi:hypothetical protein
MSTGDAVDVDPVASEKEKIEAKLNRYEIDFADVAGKRARNGRSSWRPPAGTTSKSHRQFHLYSGRRPVLPGRSQHSPGREDSQVSKSVDKTNASAPEMQ